jgi:CTP synthase
MVGTQFHPEFRSRPDRPHPLFRELIRTARERSHRAAVPAARAQEATAAVSN